MIITTNNDSGGKIVRAEDISPITRRSGVGLADEVFGILAMNNMEQTQGKTAP